MVKSIRVLKLEKMCEDMSCLLMEQEKLYEKGNWLFGISGFLFGLGTGMIITLLI